ncbi:MAG: hypothetical protein COB88_08955 [Flavobacteriales bacterium]|nr:MAG: hypothetical protein COB88_08955 [Flavobacteriales bacterium]
MFLSGDFMGFQFFSGRSNGFLVRCVLVVSIAPFMVACAKGGFPSKQVRSLTPPTAAELQTMLPDATMEQGWEHKFEEIVKLAWRTEKELLKTINLFDVYEGDKVGKGKKSYAVSFIIQDESKTLKDSEVDAIMDKLMAVYKKELGAEIR